MIQHPSFLDSCPAKTIQFNSAISQVDIFIFIRKLSLFKFIGKVELIKNLGKFQNFFAKFQIFLLW